MATPARSSPASAGARPPPKPIRRTSSRTWPPPKAAGREWQAEAFFCGPTPIAPIGRTTAPQPTLFDNLIGAPARGVRDHTSDGIVLIDAGATSWIPCCCRASGAGLDESGEIHPACRPAITTARSSSKSGTKVALSAADWELLKPACARGGSGASARGPAPTRFGAQRDVMPPSGSSVGDQKFTVVAIPVIPDRSALSFP